MVLIKAMSCQHGVIICFCKYITISFWIFWELNQTLEGFVNHLTIKKIKKILTSQKNTFSFNIILGHTPQKKKPYH